MSKLKLNSPNSLLVSKSVIPETVLIGNPALKCLKSGSPTKAFGDDNLLSGGLVRFTKFNLFAVLAALLLTAGCATTDQRVNLHYEPSVPTAGGSGELYLAQGEEQLLAPKNRAGEWILGDIIDKEGKNLGRAVTGISPSELVQQAFAAELRRAGYTVVPTRTLPGDVAKGITLSSVKIALKEVSGPNQAYARGDVKVSVALWRNGKMLATLNYATVYDDTATTDRDRLLPNTLQRSLLFVMRQALSEIIALLEKV